MCISLDGNAVTHSVLLESKNVRDLAFLNVLIQAILSGPARAVIFAWSANLAFLFLLSLSLGSMLGCVVGRDV